MVAPPKQHPRKHVGQARVSKSGQVTIPAEIRREMEIEPGDTIVYTRGEDGTFSFRKPRSAAQLAGILGPPPDGKTLTEYIEGMDRTPMVRSVYEGDRYDDDRD